MPGPFLVLDGPDGSGTTLHTRLLAERLEVEGKKVLLTAEPTNGPIGSSIRGFLASGNLQPDALQLLFTADRADHVRRTVSPALLNGTIVISDRYLHSTLAYGEALGLEPSWLVELNRTFLRPTKVIFALPPFEVCQERLGRRETKDTLETTDLQRKVYDIYVRLAKEDPSIVVIDTSGSKQEVSEKIFAAISAIL